MTIRLRWAAPVVAGVIAAVLALGVGSALAHVSVSAPDAAPGGFAELTFRVPNESDTAETTSLRVQLPTDTPLAFVSVKPAPGWTARTTTSQLDTPIEIEGSTITEAVSEVIWTADSGNGIGSGQYQAFSISTGPLPEGVDALTFPALQGYSDGTTVAWIEPAVEGQTEPDQPAPVLSLAAAPREAGTDRSSTPSAASSSDGGIPGLVITALMVGIVGLLAGIAGVALAASSTGATAPRERDHRDRRSGLPLER
ncbi:YcnI family copper-binding membrane protein [Geodermatophilus sp. URMC 64]